MGLLEKIFKRSSNKDRKIEESSSKSKIQMVEDVISTLSKRFNLGAFEFKVVSDGVEAKSYLNQESPDNPRRYVVYDSANKAHEGHVISPDAKADSSTLAEAMKNAIIAKLGGIGIPVPNNHVGISIDIDNKGLRFSIAVRYKEYEQDGKTYSPPEAVEDTTVLTDAYGTVPLTIDDFTDRYCILAEDGDLFKENAVQYVYDKLYSIYGDGLGFNSGDLFYHTEVVTPRDVLTKYLGIDYVSGIIERNHTAKGYTKGYSDYFMYYTPKQDSQNTVCVSFFVDDMIVFPKQLNKMIERFYYKGSSHNIVYLKDYADACKKSGVEKCKILFDRFSGQKSQYVKLYFDEAVNSNGEYRIFGINMDKKSFIDDDEAYKIALSIGKTKKKEDIKKSSVDNSNSIAQVDAEDEIGESYMGRKTGGKKILFPASAYVQELNREIDYTDGGKRVVGESLMYLDENKFDYDIKKYSPKSESARKLWNEIVKAKKKDDFFDYVEHNDYTITSDYDVDKLLFGFENEIRANIDLPYEINVGISEVTKNDSK